MFGIHCIPFYICCMNDEMLRLRLTKELKNNLQKLADKDKRKLSDYIRIELEKIVEKAKTKK